MPRFCEEAATTETCFVVLRNGTLETDSGTLSLYTCPCATVGKGRTKSSVRASRAVSNSCESAWSGPALALHLWRSLGSRCDLRLHCATPWQSQKVWNHHSAAVEMDDDCCHQDFYNELVLNGRLSDKPFGPSTAFLPQFGASRRSSVMRTRPFALMNSRILAGHFLLLQHRSNALVFCEARDAERPPSQSSNGTSEC